MTTDITNGKVKLRIITAYETGRGFTVPATMVFRFWSEEGLDFHADLKVYSTNMAMALKYHKKLLGEYRAKGYFLVKPKRKREVMTGEKEL